MTIDLAEIGNAVAAMEPAQAKRCGNCEHAKRLDLQFIQCFGVPPTPVVIGGTQGVFGKVELNIEVMRPRLSVNEKPCGLWVLSSVHPMLNLPGMAKA